MSNTLTLMRRLAVLALVAIAPLAAWAQGDPPGRVGRLADLQGGVSIYDAEQGQWVAAERNRPLTEGDRLSTDPNARAELRVGSTTVRLGAASELEVLRLDDERVSLQLHSGTLALRVRSREVADETEVVTDEARLRPQRSGHFRVDRIDDTTYVSSWRGEMRVTADDSGDEAFVIDNGRRAELWREGPRRSLRHNWSQAPDDAFAAWALREDQSDERSASNRYVSPEMTGAEDLDRNGRWEQNPDVGPVWVPQVVQADWAPYRYGRWAWVAPWGWTWVDDAPWGFAPFHYGRWMNWGGRWCWSPGTYVARPVYAPALVAWVGGPRIGISINIGGPSVGWVPLAPRETYVPWYRASPVYDDRVNHRPPGRGGRPEPVPTGPVMYGNQGVPGAVTVVPRDALVRREPVARAVIDWRESGGRGRGDRGEPPPVLSAAPAPTGPVTVAPGARPVPPPFRGRPAAPAPVTQVAPPTQVVPVPGGAVPVPRPPRDVPRDPPRDSRGEGPREPPRAEPPRQDAPRESPRRDGPQGGRNIAPPDVVDLRQQPPQRQPPQQQQRPAAPPQQQPAPQAPKPAPQAAPQVAPQPAVAPPPARPQPIERDKDDPKARTPEPRNRDRDRDQQR